MPKYFKVGKLLIDIGSIERCFPECQTKVTYNDCRYEGLLSFFQCTVIGQPTLKPCHYPSSEVCFPRTNFCYNIITPDCWRGISDLTMSEVCHTPMRMTENIMDLTDPRVIESVREQLQTELEHLDRLEKIAVAEMTPQTPEDVAAIEKELDKSQAQLDEARSELVKMKAKTLKGGKQKKK